MDPDLHSAAVDVATPGAATVRGHTGLDGMAGVGHRAERTRTGRQARWMIEWLVVLLVALVLAVCVRCLLYTSPSPRD